MSNAYQVARKVRDATILNLRRIFAGHPKYPYIELVSGEYDFDNTKIVISDIIPQENAFFPAVVVDVVSGPETRYIGPDDWQETKDSHNVTITDQMMASFNLIVNINVYTIDDTITRDEVLDTIYDHFKLITDDLADNGIEIQRSTFNADNKAYIRDRWYITGRITLEVYSEWTDDRGPGQHVTKIPIDTEVDL